MAPRDSNREVAAAPWTPRNQLGACNISCHLSDHRCWCTDMQHMGSLVIRETAQSPSVRVIPSVANLVTRRSKVWRARWCSYVAVSRTKTRSPTLLRIQLQTRLQQHRATVAAGTPPLNISHCLDMAHTMYLLGNWKEKMYL